MKRAILIGDGMGDYPLAELGGVTPLARARTPNADRLARLGGLGRARNVPAGMPAGSDVAGLSIMGYDPAIYYTGRGPLEAASMGVRLGADDVAFRCNLVTVKDGRMDDYSAGHLPTAEAAELVAALQRELGGHGWRFHAGVNYRHLLVTGGEYERLECTPPHDVLGEPVDAHLPRGQGQGEMRAAMARAAELLDAHPVNAERRRRGQRPANWFWPWGQGRAPGLQPLTQRYGVRGSVVAAVDLIRGICVYAGLKAVTVPGATGYLDTDYSAKARAAAELLRDDDIVVVHVEAPDEAAHAAMVEEKMTAIERFDALVVGPVVAALEAAGEYRVMVCTDHYTPISRRTHTPEPVPFAVYPRPRGMQPGAAFDEASAASRPQVPGFKVMEMLFDE